MAAQKEGTDLLLADKLNMLKYEIKNWEKKFELSRGRKPLKADLKQNPDVYKMYRKYQAYRDREKKSIRQIQKKEEHAPNPATPKKSKHEAEQHVSGFRGNAAARSPFHITPTKQLPLAIGPTPQLEGRAMGIFDIVTPRKSAFSGIVAHSAVDSPSKRTTNTPHSPKTPTSTSKLLQTPLSETPVYFNNQSVLPAELDSPLAPRKIVRSISSILADLQNMPEIDSDEERKFQSEQVEVDEEFLGESKVSDDELDRGTAPKYLKKGLKRQTKRVKMRPVDSETVSYRPSKQPENFKRLKLHNSGYKGARRGPFGRR